MRQAETYTFLVAERSLIFLEPDSKKILELLSVYREYLQQSYDRISQIDSLLTNEEEKLLIKEFFTSRDKREHVSIAIIDELTSGNSIDRQLLFNQAIFEVDYCFQQMRNNLDRLTEFNLQETEKFENEVHKNYKHTTAIILIFFALSLVFGVIISYRISQSITQPLKKL